MGCIVTQKSQRNYTKSSRILLSLQKHCWYWNLKKIKLAIIVCENESMKIKGITISWLILKTGPSINLVKVKDYSIISSYAYTPTFFTSTYNIYITRTVLSGLWRSAGSQGSQWGSTARARLSVCGLILKDTPALTSAPLLKPPVDPQPSVYKP